MGQWARDRRVRQQRAVNGKTDAGRGLWASRLRPDSTNMMGLKGGEGVASTPERHALRSTCDWKCSAWCQALVVRCGWRDARRRIPPTGGSSVYFYHDHCCTSGLRVRRGSGGMADQRLEADGRRESVILDGKPPGPKAKGQGQGLGRGDVEMALTSGCTCTRTQGSKGGPCR
jgi:hypothetical protein